MNNIERITKNDSFRLFFFFSAVCFLYTVSLGLINIKIGGILDAQSNLWLYATECIATGLGFLLCPCIIGASDRIILKTGAVTVKKVALAALFLIYVIFSALIWNVNFGSATYAFVFAAMLSMGIVCGLGYSTVSIYSTRNPNFGKLIGAGFASAIIFQFIFQQMMGIGALLFALTSAIFLGIVLCEAKGVFQVTEVDDDRTADLEKANGTPKGAFGEFIRLCLITVCFLILSSYVDEQITVLIDVADYFEWPRLFFVPGAVAVGILWDFKKIRLAPISVLLSSLLAFLMPLLLSDSGLYVIDMCVFYIYIGICFVYVSLSFMKLAALCRNPYASVAFRVLDNLITALMVFVGIGHLPPVVMTIIDIILLTIVILLMWLGGDFESLSRYEADILNSYHEAEGVALNDRLLTNKEKIRSFAIRYGLTARETEVLELLLTRDEKGDTMARTLGVSRRGFVSFTTSIYQKTETSSRVGLMQKYMSE